MIAPVQAVVAQQASALAYTAAPDSERVRPRSASRTRPAGQHPHPSGVPVGATVRAVRQGVGSPWAPLDPGIRRAMEDGFDQDLGGVRIHAGEEAARSSRALGAAAYAIGNDVVFGAGRYAPGQTAGRRLLAHELVHVLQQTPGPPRPAVGDAGADAEHEARAGAARVAAGLTPGRPRVRSGHVLARQDETEPQIPPVSVPYGGGGRLTLFPGPGPLVLQGLRLPLPGSARLTNALGVGPGPTFVLDLDPSQLVLSLLGRVDLNTSTVPGAPPGRESDPEHQARIQLVDPSVRLDLSTGRIAGVATLHVPSSYPVNLHPGTDVGVHVDSSLKDPMTWHLGAAYGPLTADATLRFHYDVGRLGAALGSGPSDLGKELTHPGVTASGTARLFGLPITQFGLDAPTTRERDHPLLGAPTPFPSTVSAGGVIIAPAGSVTSIAAPALGYSRSSFGERSGYSVTAALLPTLDPAAISAGGSFPSMFPVHAYAEVSYVNRVSDGLEVGVRAVVQLNTADLANPPHGLPPPQPGASNQPQPDPLSRDLPPLPAPVGPSVGLTIFGRFNGP